MEGTWLTEREVFPRKKLNTRSFLCMALEAPKRWIFWHPKYIHKSLFSTFFRWEFHALKHFQLRWRRRRRRRGGAEEEENGRRRGGGAEGKRKEVRFFFFFCVFG
jgi:hypothetical protein